MDYTFRSAERGDWSGSAGIEIVLGERFPGVTVFGLFLARGGYQTMKRSSPIYR